MPCLLTLFALITPRLVVLLLWFFSNWFSGMFASWIWPVLGFFIAPTTLLWYSAVQHWFDGTWSPVPVVGLVTAILIDMSPSSHGVSKRRLSD